jgi:predicted Zn-dependent protease
LAQASARSPEAARACRAVADARQARRELARARDLYALAARAPGAERAQALYGQAWCALECGELDSARQTLDTLLAVPELGELAARAAYLAGEAAWRAQDTRAAAAHYRRALAAGLDVELAPRAWLRAAEGELDAGRAAAALEALERLDEVLAVSGRPFDGLDELALTRGRALLASGRTESAVALLAELAAREPSAWSARAELELAAHARTLGDDDEALSRDLRVVARYGGEAERSRALFDAAAAFERRGDREQARAHWQELLDAHPGSALAAEARARLAALARAPAGTRRPAQAGPNRR